MQVMSSGLRSLLGITALEQMLEALADKWLRITP